MLSSLVIHQKYVEGMQTVVFWEQVRIWTYQETKKSMQKCYTAYKHHVDMTEATRVAKSTSLLKQSTIDPLCSMLCRREGDKCLLMVQPCLEARAWGMSVEVGKPPQ